MFISTYKPHYTLVLDYAYSTYEVGGGTVGDVVVVS